MPSVIANGVEQHYELAPPTNGDPHAPTIVCVHGMLVDSLASYYFTMAKPLRDAGYRVLMYDLRGHGHSERPTSGYTVDAFVDDLAALLDVLEIAEPVYLIGNSFGGTIVYGFAERHPGRVAGFSTIESEPATAEWAEKMIANLHRAVTGLGRVDATAWIIARHGTNLARRARRAKKMLDATTFQRDIPASRVLEPEQLSEITCPVLAIYGAECDLAVQAPTLEKHMPRYSSVVLPGLDHSVLVDAPSTVLDLLIGWLAEHRLDGVAA
jgi:pimeloyl-ACP methyl ester carboxylesterase